MNNEIRTSPTETFKVSEETTQYEKRIHTFEVRPFNDFFIENPPQTTNFQLFSTENNETKINKKPISRPQILIQDSCKIVSEASSNAYKRKSGFASSCHSPGQEKKKNKTRFFSLRIEFFFVKKFLKKIREISSFHDWRALSLRHYDLLNDFFISPFNSKHSITRNSRFLPKNFWFWSKILSQILDMVLHPTNYFRLFWDFVQILMNLCYFGVIPVCIGFSLEIFREMQFGFYLTFLLFGFDFFMNFRTAFYNKGELIVAKNLIVKNYLKRFFIYDFLSLLFFIWNGLLGFSTESYLVKVSGFFFIFRIRNLSRAISNFEDFLFSDEKIDNLLDFLKLIFMILLFSHWCACIWILIGKTEGSESWLHNYKLAEAPFLNQYVNAFYYVVVVINTVGFGDIVSTTLSERMFTIVFIYIACIVFAYTLNRIGIILQNINRNERDFRTNLCLINGFMKSKNIEFDLKIKIKHYLEYIWHEEKNQNRNETQVIINRLSKALKEELLLNANGKLIKEIRVLNDNFSEGTLRKIVSEMKEINLTPGDIIFTEGDLDDSLYIVRDGEAELYVEGSHQNNRTSVKICRKGACFGEISFFTGKAHLVSARSLSFCSLFLIKKSDFLSIIKENPEDFERFCEIKDQVNLYNDLSKLHVYCDCCKTPYHSMLNCPRLHLILSKEHVIRKYQHNTPQERKSFPRKRNNKSINCLLNYKRIQNKVIQFTEDLYEQNFEFWESLNENNENDGTINENDQENESSSKVQAESEDDCSIQQISRFDSLTEKNKTIEEKIDENYNPESKKIIVSAQCSSKRRTPDRFNKTMPDVINKFKDSMTLTSSSKKHKYHQIREKTREYDEDKREKVVLTNPTQVSTDRTNMRIDQMNCMDKMAFDLDMAKWYQFYYPEQNYD